MPPVTKASLLARALFPLLTACVATSADVAAAGSAIAFIENRGQLPAEVLYYAPGSPVSAYLTREGLVLDLNAIESGGDSDKETGVRHRAGHVVRLRFEGADARASFEARGSSGARFNYFQGDRAQGHRANVPSSDAVIARDLWPGIDVAFRIDADGIAYELIPKSCGRDGLARARFVWEGVDEVGTEIDGARILTTSAGSLSDRTPTTGRAGRLARLTDRAAARSQDDPGALLWSTFLGGSSDESAWDVALDSAGNVVVTGLTISTFFPTTVGAYDETYNGFGDVFVSKLDPTGSTLLWSTFLGGAENDIGYSVAIDQTQNVVVSGRTLSGDFPIAGATYDPSSNGEEDAFVLKLAIDGSALLWSSYLGGAESDQVYALALDEAGSPVVVGATGSEFDLPGFHVYRSEDRAAWHRITDELVTGDARVYRFVDAGVESGRAYVYEIEAVDGSGASARYGPVEITALTPERLSLRCEPNPESRSLGEPDRAPAAAISARSRGDLFGLEADLRQSLREDRIGRDRPDRQHAAAFQRIERGAQSGGRVEPVVLAPGDPVGSIVDVEEDAVERRLLAAEQLCNIGFPHVDAGIFERAPVQLGQGTAVPGHDRRHEFGHDDARVTVEVTVEFAQRGGQRVAQAESADQEPARAPTAEPSAGQLRERRLGAVLRAAHQFVGSQSDRELTPMLEERELQRIPRHDGAVDELPGDHRCASSCSRGTAGVRASPRPA